MPKYTTVIPTSGPAGNVFAIIGTAARLLRRLNVPEEEIDAFTKKAFASHSYAEACNIVREYFPLEGDA